MHPRPLRISDNVTVLSSKGTPGHTSPDHRGVVSDISGPHEHMGRTHYMIGIRVGGPGAGGRTSYWPDHKVVR